jgi:hypothetical protein
LRRSQAPVIDDAEIAAGKRTHRSLLDCVDVWSTNVAEQQAIGEAAVDRYLLSHPQDREMLGEKASMYELRERFQEALAIYDSVLSRNPESYNAMEGKARAAETRSAKGSLRSGNGRV